MLDIRTGGKKDSAKLARIVMAQVQSITLYHNSSLFNSLFHPTISSFQRRLTKRDTLDEYWDRRLQDQALRDQPYDSPVLRYGRMTDR